MTLTLGLKFLKNGFYAALYVKPRFLQSLASDIESLGLCAGIHPKSHLGLYRTASKRFPFFRSITNMIVLLLPLQK